MSRCRLVRFDSCVTLERGNSGHGRRVVATPSNSIRPGRSLDSTCFHHGTSPVSNFDRRESRESGSAYACFLSGTRGPLHVNGRLALLDHAQSQQASCVPCFWRRPVSLPFVLLADSTPLAVRVHSWRRPDPTLLFIQMRACDAVETIAHRSVYPSNAPDSFP